MEIATLIVGEALVLGLLFYVFHRCCPNFFEVRSLKGATAIETSASSDTTSPRSSEPRSSSVETSARQLIEKEPQLASLYERLGYSLEFEREGQSLLAEIKATLEVAVPDLKAFRDAVLSARERIRTAAVQVSTGPSSPKRASKGPDLVAQVLVARALAERAGDSLLLSVEAAGKDEARLLELLGRDPVDQLLPVVEQMPFLRDGRVIWRTPMSLELLHKKPADPRRFLRLLARLEGWVRGAKIRRGEQARAAVLDASARLRRAVEEGGTYLVTPVKALEERYAEWYLQRRDPTFMEKRRNLDRILLSLVAERGAVDGAVSPSEEEAGEAWNRAANLAASYCENPWMKSPRLAALLLSHLLVTEAGRFPAPEAAPSQESKADPRVLLKAVRDEVVTGHFDVAESVRRLRDLEKTGYTVHSLAFTLLRHCEAGEPSRGDPSRGESSRSGPTSTVASVADESPRLGPRRTGPTTSALSA